MKTAKVLSVLCAAAFVLVMASPAQDKPAADAGRVDQAPAAPRPLGLQDILQWKSIAGAELSPDGAWFVYRLSPQEGESEVVIRQTRGDKAYRFPIGEAPRFGSSGEMGFSADAAWAAFLSYPGAKEARTLRKERKRVMTSAVLVDLATGEKTEASGVRRFAFSGENPGFVAFQAYAPESQEKEKDKWTGSDLVLRELATGKEINIGNVSEFAFDKKGTRLALLIDARGLKGNGLQVRNLATGVVSVLDNDKAEYKSLGWSEKGEALAVLKGKEDKAYEDKLWSVVGFSGFLEPSGPRRVVYDPAGDKAFPEGFTVSPNRAPRWTESFDGLLFGIAEAKKKESGGEGGAAKGPGPADRPGGDSDEDVPDLVIWHWKDARLQSQQQVEERRDADFSYLSIYRVAEKTFLRLADDGLRDVTPAGGDRWAVGLDDSPYQLDGSLDGRRYRDVYVVDLKTGARRLALEKCRWFFGASEQGARLLYYEDGNFSTQDMATGRSVNITRDVPASFVDAEDDHNVVKPPNRPLGWVRGGGSVLLSDGWDIWEVPVKGGPGVNLTVDGKAEGLRYQRRFRLDPEEKGIDLSDPLFVGVYGEWTKKAGIARIDKGRPGAAKVLWDDAAFTTLRKAREADTYVYTRETSRAYPDYYVTDAGFKRPVRITDADPQQKDFLWSAGSMLVDYKSTGGQRLQAALFLPAGYTKGKAYPTIVYIYEKLSQSLNSYSVPSPYGFNTAVYTSNGYAVLMPDIVYTVNDPGRSAVACVLPALEAAAATGVVDKDRVGLQGHSWGGYQTAFLVTQTDAFAAAVAGAPLTNMISMYSSIYWNSGSANQPIFESSQGRFTGGYWDNIEAYTRNSPVYYAGNVETPLVILHNDKDGAVDWNQGIEYFNTLRRLKKRVVMLEYVGENHGLRKPANRKDYGVRMMEFFDHYLKGAPAPGWWEEGVSYLDLKDYLKERSKNLKLAERPEAKDADKKVPDKR
jgi:dienelactone hydrolase